MRILIRLEPDGPWHRRSTVDPTTTACGLALDGPILTKDHLPHENHLCKLCFSRQEIDTGKMARLLRDLDKTSDPELYFDEGDDPTPVEPIDPLFARALIDVPAEVDPVGDTTPVDPIDPEDARLPREDPDEEDP